MPTILDRLIAEDGVESVTDDTFDAFLAADDRVALLIFAGDPEKRLETADVVVVARELLRLHPDDLRLGVIPTGSEAPLMKREAVSALPSLALYHGGARLDLIPKIQDWPVYVDRIGAALTAAGRGVPA